VELILACIVENSHDELGPVWPVSIAPFQVIITLLRPEDPDHVAYAEEFRALLQYKGVDCILDDRDERPGVKFKDAELIGIPVRVTLGKRFREGKVELFHRASKEQSTVTLEDAVAAVLKMLEEYPR
jgi:prolyl-tRNA synthetase